MTVNLWISVAFCFLLVFDFTAKAATGTINSELHEAIVDSNLDAVKKAIKSGINPDAVTSVDGSTALMDAVILREYAIVEYLIGAGAHINATATNGQPVLDFAITTSDPKMVKLILDHHPNLNYTEPASALCHAMMIPSNEILQLLLNAGANPNVEEMMGNREYAESPLSMAASKNNVEVMKILIQHGANVNQPCSGRGGVTPIYDAIISGRVEAVQLLIASKADLKFRTPSGTTPLKYAHQTTTHDPTVKANKEKIIALLIAAGANE